MADSPSKSPSGVPTGSPGATIPSIAVAEPAKRPPGAPPTKPSSFRAFKDNLRSSFGLPPKSPSPTPSDTARTKPPPTPSDTVPTKSSPTPPDPLPTKSSATPTPSGTLPTKPSPSPANPLLIKSSPTPTPTPTLTPSDTLPTKPPSNLTTPAVYLHGAHSSPTLPSPEPAITPENQSAWKTAFDSLRPEDQAQLDESDIQSSLRALTTSAQATIDDSQSSRWTYTRRSGETVVIRDVAEKMLGWVDRIKAIGDIVVQFDPVHAALPWAGFRFLLGLVTADVRQKAAIMVGVEMMAGVVDMGAIYEELWLSGDRTTATARGLEKELVALYANVLVYLVKARRYYEKNMAVRIAVAVVQADDLEEIMAEIESGEGKVHRAAERASMEFQKTSHGAQTEGHQKLLDILQNFKVPIERMDSRISDLHTNLAEQNRSAILDWLSTTEYTGHHNRACQNRLSNSGQWLLQKPAFREWRSSTSASFLWLHGIAGAGKTKLTSLIVDIIPSPLAFFYCDLNDPTRCNSEFVLRAIIRQLSILDPHAVLPAPVVAKYNDSKKTDSLSSALDIDEYRKLIVQLLSNYPSASIVVDALDECNKDTRARLINALLAVVDAAPGVKVFVSSREDEDIARLLKSRPQIGVGAKDNKDDIERFIKTEIRRRINDGELLAGEVSEELEKYIVDTLIARADGMFMWVNLQIANLCDGERFHLESDVRNELGKLPKDLEQSYSLVLAKVTAQGEQSRVLAEKTLRWIMCAQRPLSTGELIEVITTDTGIVGVRKETVLRFCHGLVVWDGELDVFKFAHLSVKEYLERDAFKTVDAHAMAAEVCLKLLCAEEGRPRVIEGYCKEYWGAHVRLCGEESTPAVTDLQTQFFQLGKDQTKTLKDLDSNESQAIATKLFTAVEHGLTDSVRQLLALEGTNVNARNDGRETPLLIACYQGWEAVARLLLDHGADPNAVATNYWTPLLRAVHNQDAAMAELLIERGAEPNMLTKDGWTPIQWVISKGYTVMVRLLLDKGVDPNYVTPYNWTPLLCAVEAQDEEIVKLLIERGANSNQVTDPGWTPIQWAASKGFERMVVLLLERGVNPDHATPNHWTPLLRAMTGGHEQIAKLLLAKGADPNKLTEDGWTPLQWAASKGYEPMVAILLEAGADPNFVNPRNWTPLLQAMEGGHGQVVRLLLENGADPSKFTKDGWTPLQWAASNGYEPMVVLLLEHGADPDYVSPFNWTPLLRAIGGGHERIAKLLISKGADPSKLTKDEWTPLQWAASKGYEPMVALLLAEGVDPNHINPSYWTPLLQAMYGGHRQIVQLLLEKGADPGMLTKDGWTPLQWAASKGYDAWVKLLLESGADPNMENPGAWTPLLRAVHHGYDETARILIEGGADTNILNREGWTPLQKAAKSGYEKVVRVLLEKGAKKDTKNSNGTARDIAVENGNAGLVPLLD